MTSSLQHIKGYLVDLDGTTYIGDSALPGAVDFFATLNARGIPYLFFSNNPTKHADEYAHHLTQMGIEATPEQIITSTHATIAYLHEQQLISVYSVGTPGFMQELEEAGIQQDEGRPQAIVISFDTTLTYQKIKTAALLLQRQPELPYIATNPDRVCPTPDGPIPDCGALMSLLHTATDRSPHVIGKPHSGMVELAAQRLQLPYEQLAIIGDRLYTDMKMAHDHGLTAILVLSGETTSAQAAGTSPTPDVIVQDLSELSALL